MAAVTPTGNGPFEFTDSNGKQISIPLTAFSFDALGKLLVDSNWTSITSFAPASTLLDYVQKQGLIAPAPVPSPKPAAIIKAAFPGPAGNNIAIQISSISVNPDPTKTTFDFGVVETQQYSGLTFDNIDTVLGTATVTGSQPGRVHVTSKASTAGVPAKLSTSLPVVPAKVKATLDVTDGASSHLFTLEARDPGSDGTITVTIGNIAGTAFDLKVVWNKSSNAVTTGSFQGTLASDFKGEITAAAPSGGVFSVPAAGTTILSGGGGAANASAILVAQ
jgi:hypothetical protein